MAEAVSQQLIDLVDSRRGAKCLQSRLVGRRLRLEGGALKSEAIEFEGGGAEGAL